MNVSRHLGDFLGHDHSETPGTSQIVSIQIIDRNSDG